jgi:hypothetical protein
MTTFTYPRRRGDDGPFFCDDFGVKDCPADTFNIYEGSLNCSSCPFGSKSVPGSTTCSCEDGFASSGTGDNLVCRRQWALAQFWTQATIDRPICYNTPDVLYGESTEASCVPSSCNGAGQAKVCQNDISTLPATAVYGVVHTFATSTCDGAPTSVKVFKVGVCSADPVSGAYVVATCNSTALSVTTCESSTTCSSGCNTTIYPSQPTCQQGRLFSCSDMFCPINKYLALPGGSGAAPVCVDCPAGTSTDFRVGQVGVAACVANRSRFALVVGGLFTVVGSANLTTGYIAAWDGMKWRELGVGLNGPVLSLFRYSTTSLFASGTFSAAASGAPLLPFLARWTGLDWTSVGGTGTYVSAWARNRDGYLVAGENINKQMSQWNGTSGWSPTILGQFSANARVAVNFLDALIIAGDFQSMTLSNNDVLVVNYVASCTWLPVPSCRAIGTGVNGPVTSLALYVDLSNRASLVVAGFFTAASGNSIYYIALTDGTTWTALGAGCDDVVQAVAVSGTSIYAGGGFSKCGSAVGSPHISMWNGAQWRAMQGGTDGTVYVVAVFNDLVVAGGDFMFAGSRAAHGIAAWNGTTWSALGGGVNGAVRALAVTCSLGWDNYPACDQCASGYYGAQCANRCIDCEELGRGTCIAGRSGQCSCTANSGWTGPTCSTCDLGWYGAQCELPCNECAQNGVCTPGLVGYCKCNPGRYGSTCASSVALYAGGDFDRAGTSIARKVAAWNGTAWSALAGGVDGRVVALVAYGSLVVAGGNFSNAVNANGVAVQAANIAAWNGTIWSPLGTGMDDIVLCLTVFKAELVAGGPFVRAGGVTVNRIARWNGASWQSLGTGVNGPVLALTVYSNFLLAGGNFTIAGGVAVLYHGQWDDFVWTSFSSNLTALSSACACGEDVASVRAFTVANSLLIMVAESPSGCCATQAYWSAGRWQRIDAAPGQSRVGASSSEVITVGCSPSIWQTSTSGVGVYQNTSRLFAGSNGCAYAVLDYDGDLHFAGSFTAVLAQPNFGTRIASWSLTPRRWTGTQLTTLAQGFDNIVYALATAVTPIVLPIQVACSAGNYYSAPTNTCKPCAMGSTSVANATTCVCISGYASLGAGDSLTCTGTSIPLRAAQTECVANTKTALTWFFFDPQRVLQERTIHNQVLCRVNRVQSVHTLS